MTRALKIVLALQLAGLLLSLVLHNGEVTLSGLVLMVLAIAVLLPGSIIVILLEHFAHWNPHLSPRLQSLETATLAAIVNLLIFFLLRKIIAART
jgi:hypothetical protein